MEEQEAAAGSVILPPGGAVGSGGKNIYTNGTLISSSPGNSGDTGNITALSGGGVIGGAWLKTMSGQKFSLNGYIKEMIFLTYPRGLDLTETGISEVLSTINFSEAESITAPICFIAGSILKTDQGNIKIEDTDITKHTINGEKIKALTTTVSEEDYLVKIMKGALKNNMPNKDTVVSRDHKIMYRNKWLAAGSLVKLLPNRIFKIENNKPQLYNILLNKYATMIVNNLLVETLHPEHIVAKLYNEDNCEIINGKLEIKPRRKWMITQINECIRQRDLNKINDLKWLCAGN